MSDTSNDPIKLINEQIKTGHKLLLLYLIDKMDIALSNAQISQFTLEEGLMDYFELQQSLSALAESGYIDIIKDSNTTRYAITEEGLTTLDFFEKHIPPETRNKIDQYTSENRKSFKKDYEITANYFYDHANNEFIVKCGVYEDETMLMEINASVVTRDQAKLICGNWKKNVNQLYVNIISELVQRREPDEPDKNTDDTYTE